MGDLTFNIPSPPVAEPDSSETDSSETGSSGATD
jgi:hypothetical protein